MANNGLKTLLKTDLIDMIRSSISNQNRHYLFVARSSPYEDNPVTTSIVESDYIPPSVGESSRNVYDTYRNMLFMKKIRPENMRLVLPRVDWTYGDTYTAYSETTDMADKQYYVLTTEFNVYKCMASNGTSRVMPTGRSTDVVTYSDGYKWKYIYSVPEDDIEFITLEYIPVFVSREDNPEQKEVQNLAKPGSIDSVSINASLSPTFSKIFRNTRFISNANTASIYSDLGLTANAAGSTLISFIPSGEESDATTGYWNNYAIYVSSGPGVGQYFRILNFVKGGSGVSYYYASVYPAIQRSLSDTSAFKIVPNVVVDGDGEGAVVVPTTSYVDKKITGLSVINPGRNYTYAKPRVTTESGSISLGSAISDLNDSISVSLSIPRGHGYNAIKELGTSNLMVVVEVEGTEDGKISTRNDYRQFGIVKDPYLYGGITLAGSEDVVVKALLKRQPTKEARFSPTTFVAGNRIIGRETNASARIVSSESIPGSQYRRLFLTDVVGNFRLSDDASDRMRVYFGNSYAGSFVTGDTAIQYSNIPGVTLSASGTVVSFDLYDKSVLIDTTFGGFTSGGTIYFSGGYTLNYNDILDVSEEFGEYVGQVAIGETGGSEYLTFNGDEIFGRLTSTELLPFFEDNAGEYRLTTKATLVSGTILTDGILNGSYAVDGILTQTSSTTLRKVTADIVDFGVTGGVGYTGIAHLCNVKGEFNTTDSIYFTPAGSTAVNLISGTLITSIENSEIEIGSGELLYIENVRPIERNIEQSEQFKIVIGF